MAAQLPNGHDGEPLPSAIALRSGLCLRRLRAAHGDDFRTAIAPPANICFCNGIESFDVHIIAFSTAPEQAWANGAGTTRELWRVVDGEGGNIIFRISVATLTGPADFSKLPGLSRTFMPVDDMTAVLSIDGQQRHLGQHEPVQFRGDADISLVALDRPGRALNLMSDRRLASHDMALQCAGRFSCQAVMALEDWTGSLQLQVGDLILPSGAPVVLGGKAAVIEFARRG